MAAKHRSIMSVGKQDKHPRPVLHKSLKTDSSVVSIGSKIATRPANSKQTHMSANPTSDYHFAP